MDQFANSKLIDVLNKLTNGNKLVQFQVTEFSRVKLSELNR